MRHTRLKSCAGFTLIELAIVLGVFSIVMAALWIVASLVYENVRQHQLSREVQTIVQNIRQVSNNISRFTVAPDTDLTQTYDQQGVFPREMRLNPPASDDTADGILNHPWSTLATGTARVFSRVDNTHFGVSFIQMPRKACVGMATKLSGSEISGLSALRINGNTYTGAALPLTVVVANAACNNGDTNLVEWQFTLRDQ